MYGMMGSPQRYNQMRSMMPGNQMPNRSMMGGPGGNMAAQQRFNAPSRGGLNPAMMGGPGGNMAAPGGVSGNMAGLMQRFNQRPGNQMQPGNQPIDMGGGITFQPPSMGQGGYNADDSTFGNITPLTPEQEQRINAQNGRGGMSVSGGDPASLSGTQGGMGGGGWQSGTMGGGMQPGGMGGGQDRSMMSYNGPMPNQPVYKAQSPGGAMQPGGMGGSMQPGQNPALQRYNQMRNMMPGNQMQPGNQMPNRSMMPGNQMPNRSMMPGNQMPNRSMMPGNQMQPGNQMPNRSMMGGNQMQPSWQDKLAQRQQSMGMRQPPGYQMQNQGMPQWMQGAMGRMQGSQPGQSPYGFGGFGGGGFGGMSRFQQY